MVDELTGEFVYDSSHMHSELLLKLYLSHLHQDIAGSMRDFKLQSQMSFKLQAKFDLQSSSNTPDITLHHLQEYVVVVESQMAVAGPCALSTHL